MKKLICVLLASVLLLSCLTSCGKSGYSYKFKVGEQIVDLTDIAEDFIRIAINQMSKSMKNSNLMLKALKSTSDTQTM